MTEDAGSEQTKDPRERFSGRVEAYARYRSPYPAERLLLWLRQTCGLERPWEVADIAAGTGMLTEVLLSNGNPVVAVEPNAEMRAACERLESRYAELEVREGTAEATGLSRASVQMLTAARAFHWFDPPRAMEEFRRVVRPGGWVVLVLSGRHRDDGAQERAFEMLEARYGNSADRVRSRAERRGAQEIFLRELAGDGQQVQTVEFLTERRLDWESFRGAVQSSSVAPLPTDEGFPAMQRALRDYFEQWSREGRLRMDEHCSVDAVQLPA